MLTQRLSPRRRWLTATLVVTALAAGTPVARTIPNTSDPLAFLTDTGRGVIVTRPITGTAGEPVFQRVTVTRSTDHGITTAADQWLVDVTLVTE